MKKIISLLLVFVLVLSIALVAGCAQSEISTDTKTTKSTEEAAEPEPKEINLEATLPNEYVQKKLDSGMEVQIAFSWYNLVDDFIVQLCENLGTDLEKLGFTFSYSNASGDLALQQSHIENYAEMGVCCIGVHSPDAGNLKDLSAELLDEGIYCCFFSTLPDFNECGGSCYVDDEMSGSECAKMAIAWLDRDYADASEGGVKAALLGANNTTNNTKRTEAMRAGIQTDNRVDLCYTEELVNTIDGGYTAAEAATSYDSDIRLFLYFSTAAAVGGNNYLTSINGADLTKYGIFTTSNSDAVYELIDASETSDGSCLRGTISQGGDYVWQGMYEVMTGILLNGVEVPFFRPDPLWATNTVGYEFSTK